MQYCFMHHTREKVQSQMDEYTAKCVVKFYEEITFDGETYTGALYVLRNPTHDNSGIIFSGYWQDAPVKLDAALVERMTKEPFGKKEEQTILIGEPKWHEHNSKFLVVIQSTNNEPETLTKLHAAVREYCSKPGMVVADGGRLLGCVPFGCNYTIFHIWYSN